MQDTLVICANMNHGGVPRVSRECLLFSLSSIVLVQVILVRDSFFNTEASDSSIAPSLRNSLLEKNVSNFISKAFSATKTAVSAEEIDIKSATGEAGKTLSESIVRVRRNPLEFLTKPELLQFCRTKEQP